MPIPNGRPSIQSLVRADLEEREQVGIERYGTSLQCFNGRDALRDLYEELLDACQYVKQVLEERATRTQAWVDAADIFADRAAELRHTNTAVSLTMADTYAAAVDVLHALIRGDDPSKLGDGDISVDGAPAEWREKETTNAVK